MSIGVTKVNGGFIGGQWTEGSLTFLKIVTPAQATTFDGSYALTPTEKGPRPAPGSAAEAVYQAISQFGTPVIAEIVDGDKIHVAMAYGTGVSGNNVRDAVRAIGAAAVLKRFGDNAAVTSDDDVLQNTAALDFSDATVTEVDFELA